MIKELKQLDFGIYKQASKASAHDKHYINLSDTLETMALKGEVEPGLIRFGKDQPVNSKGRAVSAVEQMLAHSGARLGGLNASTFGIFSSKESEYIPGAEVLFPAWAQETFERKFLAQHGVGFTVGTGANEEAVFRRDYRAGQIDQRIPIPSEVISLDQLVSFDTGIDGDGYKTAVLAEDAAKGARFSRVAERAEFPTYTIKLSDKEVKVYKYGARVNASYEALRRMRINKLAILLEQMAINEEQNQIRMAIETAINGDGNANAALNTNVVGPFTIDAINEWVLRIAYEKSISLSVAIANLTELLNVMKLRNPQANMQLSPQQLAMYQGGGQTLPTGTPVQLAPEGSMLDALNKILGWNTARGLERVVENGSQIEESAKFITNQTVDWIMSINMGFSKPFNNSFFTLTRA